MDRIWHFFQIEGIITQIFLPGWLFEDEFSKDHCCFEYLLMKKKMSQAICQKFDSKHFLIGPTEILATKIKKLRFAS